MAAAAWPAIASANLATFPRCSASGSNPTCSVDRPLATLPSAKDRRKDGSANCRNGAAAPSLPILRQRRRLSSTLPRPLLRFSLSLALLLLWPPPPRPAFLTLRHGSSRPLSEPEKPKSALPHLMLSSYSLFRF